MDKLINEDLEANMDTAEDPEWAALKEAGDLELSKAGLSIKRLAAEAPTPTTQERPRPTPAVPC